MTRYYYPLYEQAGCKPMKHYDPSRGSAFQNFFYIPHIACVKRKIEDEKLHLPKKKAPKVRASFNKRKENYTNLFENFQERLKACSGRDEMCNTVLNDDWASHPTWASEDSGFVTHRKNIFEEALHRIEEERHDYDFNIEANAKVIQLLEPIGQQILGLTQPELVQFRMPIGLGGQSQSIYKRVFKKIYGPERGLEVARDIFQDPISVLPVVLARLKQKDEEWRFTQVATSSSIKAQPTDDDLARVGEGLARPNHCHVSKESRPQGNSRQASRQEAHWPQAHCGADQIRIRGSETST